MKPSRMLTITSVLLIALAIAHLAQDVAYGYEPGTVNNLLVVPFAVIWLYGTLVLAERRAGYIINLLFSLFSLVVPLVHAQGKGFGVASRMAHTTGHFFFVYSLLLIGILGVFSPRTYWRSRDCLASPGAIAGPCLPPESNASKLETFNPPAGLAATWQVAQCFSRIGRTP